MKSAPLRLASAVDEIPGETTETEIKILRLEAGIELHEIAHRLWAGGERMIAPDCLRVAARCSLAEAEVDLLVWRNTDEQYIPDCDITESEELSARPPASRKPLWVAASILALASVAGLATIIGPHRPGGPEATEVTEVTAGLTGRNAMPAVPRFSPLLGLPTSVRQPVPAPAPTARTVTLATRPELRVDLGTASKAQDYLVSLSSATAATACSWRIVKATSDGRQGAAKVALEPGASQVYLVQGGDWSSLSVVHDTLDPSGDCTVVGYGLAASGDLTVPALEPPTPAPTEPSGPVDAAAPSTTAGASVTAEPLPGSPSASAEPTVEPALVTKHEPGNGEPEEPRPTP